MQIKTHYRTKFYIVLIVKLCKGCGDVFIVFRQNEIEKGYFKRKKQIKRIRKSDVQTVKSENGLPFYVVDIPLCNGEILWNGIEEKCGRYASRIVASRDVPIPDSNRLKRYIPTVLPSEIIFNTAILVLKSALCRPDSFALTLTDRNGILARRANELLPFSSEVRIITRTPEKYIRPAAEAMNDFGATLIIRESHSPAQKREIVICCDGATAPSMQDCAVFSNKKYACGKLSLCGSNITLTPEHSGITSDYINPVDFAGALSELCGSQIYSSAVFSDTEINSIPCDMRHMCECISAFCTSNAR